jgi:pimeloyl-ACP methyl ester carboxylesterase
MPHTTAEGPAIFYDTHGSSEDEPIVLVAGAGAQMIWWRAEFIQRLVDRGFFVIRFDNRDVGLSEKFGGPGDAAAAYSVNDMADDVCRVLDTLGIAAAHVVGQSLGGAITQTMAIAAPTRVKSIVLFYTVPAIDPRYLGEALVELLQSAATATPPSSREQAIEMMVERERATASTAYAFDEEWMRTYHSDCYDRCYCPDGVERHAAAGVASGDRSDALRTLAIPAAIIHGREDRLLKVEGGFELGRLIPDSELHIYPGMGHEFPYPLWDEFIAIIARTAARAAG